MRNVVALIPAKANSTRVPNKNFRDFHNSKSLLEVKIEQCLASNVFESIYISSDSLEARKIAEKMGVKFLLRDPRLCLDETPWSEVLCGILNDLPIASSDLVAWSPLTTPLFNRFAEAISLVKNNQEHDSLLTVTRLQHYFLNADYIPMNFQYGVWASYSQKIKPIYQMNCALWLATKGAMLQNRFQIGDKPIHMETTLTEGLDIDTLEEFELAKVIYQMNTQKKLAASDSVDVFNGNK